jgi:hypothetical protein
MAIPADFAEGALRLMLKQRVQDALNPFFKGMSELVANVAVPGTEVEVRKELLQITEQVLGEIMNEMKLRAEKKPERRIKFGYPAERLE